MQLISITTQTLIKTLQFNPAFDVITDISQDIDLLHNQVDCMSRDPFTFTNYFIPLRMHVETKDKISAVVSRLKPDSKLVYYGLILAEKSVVGLIKNDPSITIIPSGKYSFAYNTFQIFK
jgi:hypothetical protein